MDKVTRWDTLEAEVIGRFTFMEDEKREVIADWEESSAYCNKRRVNYQPEENRSRNPSSPQREKTTTETFTDIPAMLAQTMVTSFQGMTISPAARWFALRPENSRYDEIPYIGDWLEAVEEEIYKVFRMSNFYAAINEYILDAIVIGTACMWVEETSDMIGIRFSTRHMKEIYISETEEEIDVVAREFHMKGRELLHMEEEEGWELAEERHNHCLQNPEVYNRVIHFVSPTAILYNEPDSRKEYASIYLMPQDTQIVFQDGYEELPAFTWRWRKNSNEMFGYGPGLEYIKTIKRFNLIAKELLSLDQKLGDPPKNSPADMRQQGGSKTLPRYDNYYSDTGLKTEIIDLSRGHPPVFQEYQEVKQEVAEAFMIPFFLVFSQAEREMTATEVSERMSEKAAILSNVVGRLYQECLNPMINRLIGILNRANRLPKMPPPLDKMVEEMVPRVEMLGPLAMAQKRYHQTSGMKEGAATLGMLAQFDPKVLHVPDFVGAARDALSASGWPENRIKEWEEIMQSIAAAEKAAAEQAQMQQMLAGAEALDKTSQAPDPGSPAEAALNMMAAPAEEATRQ